MPQVSPWQLIRDRTAAKARAVRFIVVRVHRQWLKLRSEGAARPHARVAVDDDDAREVRGNALLVAAGWRTGPHVPWSIWGLRDQLTGAGRATAMGEVTATEVQVEMQARPNPSGNAGGRRTGSTGGSSGDDTQSNRDGNGGDSSSGAGVQRMSSARFSHMARGEVADHVTRRLLTASNTDWRLQPNAVDVCKAPTPAQVPQSSQATTRPSALSHPQLALPSTSPQIHPTMPSYIRPRTGASQPARTRIQPYTLLRALPEVRGG